MDNNNVLNFQQLRQIALFKTLSDEDLKKVLELTFIKEYLTGAVLFNEGMDGDVMYIIVDGEIELYRKNANKEAVTLVKLKNGDFFGEMSIIESEKRTAGAKTVINTKLLVITRRAFQRMLEVSPNVTSQLLMELLKVVSHRLRLMSKPV